VAEGGAYAIAVERVSRRYVRGRAVVEAVAEASFKLRAGRFGVIYGPSGSGKSTLLNIIAGFLRPSSGRVLVDGLEVSRAPWSSLVRLRREKLSYAMQANLVLPRLSVEYNIALPLMIRGVSSGDALREARSMASELGLGHTIGRPAYTLSGGELRRLVVARSLIANPRIILLDEPTSNMDDETSSMVWSIVRERAREAGATVLAATHDQQGKMIGETLLEARNGFIRCVNNCD
jgi:putative ABC transport system ATP-binding protein